MGRALALWIGIMTFGLFASDVIGDIPVLVNLKSGALVLAGTLLGGALSIPSDGLRGFLNSILVSLKQQASDLDGLIRQIVDLARLHRVCDIRDMDKHIQAVEDPFLKRGLQKVCDYHDRQRVEESMEKEIGLYLAGLQSHLTAINHFSRLAPVFGFVGTIIGLINILNHIDNASQIGHGMAVSLLTTFYGLLLANFLFVPLAGKLAAHIQQETLKLSIIFDGVLAMCEQRLPLEIAHRLQSFVETTTVLPVQGAPGLSRQWQKLSAMLKSCGLAR